MTKEELSRVGLPFAIVTNTKTGKWFRTKFKMALTYGYPVTIVPENINGTVPVIGTPRSDDWNHVPKKECPDINEELHVEIFNKDKIMQAEFLLYNALVECVNRETNEIILSCNWVNGWL